MIKNKKGSILIFSMIILTFLLVTALSAATVTVSQRKITSATNKSDHAFQVADTGVEAMLNKIYKNSTNSTLLSSLGTCVNGTISGSNSDGSTYEVSFYDNDRVKLSCGAERRNIVAMRSRGQYQNTERAIEAGVREDDGLVSHWKVERISDSVGKDSSGKGNYVRMANSRSSTEREPDIVDDPDNPGFSMIHFYGDKHGYATANPENTSDAFYFKDDVTVSLWIKTASNRKAIFGYQKGNDGTIYLAIGQTANVGIPVADNPDNNLVIYLRGVIGPGDVCDWQSNAIADSCQYFISEALNGGETINDNDWHQVAFTRSVVSNKVRLYIDGELNRTYEYRFSGPLDTRSGGHTLGNLLGNESEDFAFNGDMRNIRVYDRALTEDDIQDLYQLEKP